MVDIASPVVILGARSDIGRALARRYAEAGADVVLAARNAGDLEADRADLEVRYGRRAEVVDFDVNAADPDAFFARLGGAPGTVVLVAGLLGDQTQSAAQDATAREVMDTNYTGPARFLLAAARIMRERQSGCLIGISSVAGDRGRGSNFIYGSAKAGLTAFLSGLRNELAAKGVHVMTVKPGFVATAMTANMDLPGALTAQPDEVARAVVAAQRGGRDVIYVRPVWWLIMTIIRAIPERVFKRLSL
jgi:decaprenylphospho-beta-D-erythro-pentofuranosid-2-ulose 2-reductase